jgi:hypothetical protein
MPWRLVDNVLAPREEIVLNYSGPNPFSVYYVLRRCFDVIVKVQSKDVFEDLFKWDITSDPRSFFVKFRVRKGYDNFTKGFIFIELDGEQPSDPSKNGKVSIRIRSTLETEWKIDGFKRILFPIVYLYHLSFYNARRRRYLDELKSFIYRIEEEIRNNFNIK